MQLSLFDTHCDTAYELYHRGCGLLENNCHIDMAKASCYDRYAQYYAVWSNRRLDDESCFEDFLKITADLDKKLSQMSDVAIRVRHKDDLISALSQKKHAVILAVEDARLTAGKLERLDTLKDMGVKYLTLLWGGETCVGGSHDTSSGLTSFGKALSHKCFDIGIIPDISHASEQSVDDLLSIAYEHKKPIIATHSNAYTVYPHSRNLRDRHFAAIKELGGVVGVSLCRSHLTDTREHPATPDHVFEHIDYYMGQGGEDMVGFGCDWDGTDLPDGISHVGDLSLMADVMARHGYSDELIHKIFYLNFYHFAIKNI